MAERFLLKKEDKYLLQALTPFGKIKWEDDDRVTTESTFLANVLGMITCFPTSYEGSKDPRAIAGVKLVAAFLGDRYDMEGNKLERKKSLEQGYFQLIAQQAEKDFFLVAFDESWVFAGLRNFPKIVHQLQVSRFNKLYMVFAQVTRVEQEEILTWLYQNEKLFNPLSAVGFPDYSLPEINDIQHLFPIEVSFLGNICLFESSLLDQDQIEKAVSELQMSYRIQGLDPIKATFAAHLTMENTNFNYPIEWDSGVLRIWSAGYLGSEDCKFEFLRCLDQIETSNLFFTEIPQPIISGGRGKQFYTEYRWYGVSSEKTSWEGDPLQGEEDLLWRLRQNQPEIWNSAIRGYQALGYSWTPEIETYDLPIGFQTIETEGQILTTYYYQSTQGKKIDVAALNGGDEGRHSQIQELSNQGFFLPQVVKSIFKRYPNFILSSPTLSRNLPS